MNKIANEKTGADIVVEVIEENIEFYGNDVFLNVESVPPFCIGLSWEGNRVSITHALQGHPVKMYVESPMEAGSAFFYEMEEAIDALLEQAGIRITDSGKFAVETTAVAGARPLTDFSEVVTKYSDRRVDNPEDLMEELEYCDYYGATWD